MIEEKDYRTTMMTHILYIKEKVDNCENHLEKLNGRVRANEKAISRIVSIGSTLAFMFTAVMSYLGFKN
tara:strand:- start:3809 stop:4015 length:207 start_codon:yes stop_codon:yes gene_type:complete